MARVRLVRALVEHAGLSLDAVRRVVDTLDAPPPTRHELLGAAATLAPPTAAADGGGSGRDLVDRLGWRVHADGPQVAALGRAVEARRSAGVPVDEPRLRRYAAAMREVARVDLDLVDGATSPAEAVRTVVVGTTLVDPLLLVLRRLAQEAESADRG
ncbi:hypothetical protein EPD83_008925 [Phycicoccus sp. CMS6Z-2]|uniref:Uncharacterized protein n=1 Tax=Phycicoccus flavus TaxID=2502783 RepID=A0A8T6R3B9_9MICO|nr:hypothetical protein [Phycicoccus flavus]NHA68174.1 hypothetical protein [Phycicoccus flavus]